MRTMQLLLTLFASLLLGSCGGGSSDPGANAAPNPVLTSISITPASNTIAKGTTVALSAIGTYSNNSTADITTTVTWSTAAPGTASVGDKTGVVTGVAVGSTTVAATLDGINAPTAAVTVTAATLTGITISPPAVTVMQGATTPFTATGSYSDGTTGDISGSVTWQSSASAVVTVNNGGIATGVVPGASSITATLGSLTSNAASLTVTAASGTLVSIAITPPRNFLSPRQIIASSVAVGSAIPLKATASYADGSTADITASATWSSVDPTVATVGPATGVATGRTEGSSVIFAAANGVTSPGITLTVYMTYTIRTLTLGGVKSEAHAINAAGQVVGIEEMDPDGPHAYLYGQGLTKDLGLVGIYKSLFLNASGQVAGTRIALTGDQHAFLYSEDVLQDLGTLGGPTSEVGGINDNGYVVGTSERADLKFDAFLYRNAPPMVDIGTLGAAYRDSVGLGINNAGLIVGASVLNASPTYPYHPFVYEGGIVRDLGIPAGAQGWALAINQAGQVMASISSATLGTHAFLFSAGVLQDLGTLGTSATYPAGYAMPTGLNDAGQVVGWSMTPNLKQDAFLYRNGVMTDLGDTGGALYAANWKVFINNPGQVVGGLLDFGNRSRAFLHSKDLTWWLQDVVPGAAAAGWTELYRATGINDGGLIIGNGRLASGEFRAFVLEPITGQ